MATTAGHDPVVGQTLKGTYKVERQLAAGGMGVIYRASHVRLPKKYAIKVLTQELARNENVITRFQREAEIVAALGHPHIVDVVDFDALDTGQRYMVMEFLEGEDLADRLRRGPLPLPSTVRVFMDVCDALDKAHAQGVVHRDLKPDNIFLTQRSGRDDYAKVLDFGISKILEAAGTQMTMDQSVMGTPSYMSPEQAAGEVRAIDQRTDIFALGAILFECLTGRVAYPGTTPLAVIAKITSEPPPRVLELRPDLPPGLQEVALRALAHSKAHRYATAGEMCQDLIAASGVSPEELGRPASYPGGLSASGSRLPATQPPQPYLQSTLSAAAGQHSGVPPTHNPAAAPAPAAGGSKTWMAIVGVLAAAGVGIGAYALTRGGGGAGQSGTTGPGPGPGPGPTTPPAHAPREPRPALASLGKLLRIAGGSFSMGTDHASAQWERPRHVVEVAPFWLAETETTNADYALFLRRADASVPRPTGWASKESYPAGKATTPVVGIDWESAVAYCAWAYPGGGRLPTEAEWEWAARGPDGREYPWGNELDEAAANFGARSRGELAPVGSYPAGKSRDGVHDLAGNAMEWTASELTYYDGRDIGDKRGRRVMRGGSFQDRDDDALRAWYRNFDVPAKTSDLTGFRCAWAVAP
jgi:serine/threonine-protein kinase